MALLPTADPLALGLAVPTERTETTLPTKRAALRIQNLGLDSFALAVSGSAA